jgi:hypothetical protein
MTDREKLERAMELAKAGASRLAIVRECQMTAGQADEIKRRVPAYQRKT